MPSTPAQEPSRRGKTVGHSRGARRSLWASLLVGLALSAAACSGDEEAQPALSVPESPNLEPERAPQPQRPRSKNAVTYTIARGGTLLNVANLYKIHHHEIIELNPSIDPEQQLGPNTEVVVYDQLHEDSESVGLPHDGKLVGAVPMLNGPGRIITAERWKTWGTRNVIRQLDRVLRRWAKQQKGAPPILVGNISARHGGPLSPHKTHQSGRDVDLSYVAKWDGSSRVTWQVMDRSNLDRARTWALLKTLKRYADIEVIYVDRRIQRLLHSHALETGIIRKDQLSQWLEVAPGAKRGKTLLQHVPGHDDHLHVRFACSEAEKRCRS